MLVEVNNISHIFDYEIYKNVSFKIEKGQSIAILGVSGSGKSTILNSVSALLKPTSGIINIKSYKNIYSLKEKEILFLRSKILGIIFQSHYLFKGFNVLQNLEVAKIISKQNIDFNILEEFNILHTLKQQIGELSGGQQQRLSIARILTKRPEVLIADEATGNLDNENAQNIMKYIFHYVKKNNACLLLATHDKNIALKCDHIFYIQNKELIQES